jgi:hypothetical protein
MHGVLVLAGAPAFIRASRASLATSNKKQIKGPASELDSGRESRRQFPELVLVWVVVMACATCGPKQQATSKAENIAPLPTRY